MSLGRPAAGKTGTTEENAAVWFCGYTPELATVVWVGDPRGGQKYPLRNITIDGQYYPVVYGGTFPGPIWKRIMLAALADVPPSSFPGIDPSVIKGVTVQVPDLTGLDPTNAVAQLEALGLTAAVATKRVASGVPEGTVAYTNPRCRVDVSSGRHDHDLRQHRRAARRPSRRTTPDPSPTPDPSVTPDPTGSPAP